MFNIKSLCFLILSFLLISCQSPESFNQKSATEQWQIRKQILTQINAFQVNGSIAYLSDKTRSYGRFLINQKAPNDYNIKLTSPIGTSVLTINVTPIYAELIDHKKRRYTARNIEGLMQRMSTVNIPFDSLQNWLKGLSIQPNHDKIDNSGRLLNTQFMQNNHPWQLVISDYMTREYKRNDIDLPASIELKNDHETIRLKISNWILN